MNQVSFPPRKRETRRFGFFGILGLGIAMIGLLPPESGASEGRETGVWTQWRGLERDGRVPSDRTWPARLSEGTLQKVWKVDLGPGYSGPIVTEDRVFVCETEEKKREVVRALDRRTGKELWKAGWKGAMTVPFFARANGSWIRSTPAFDGERLYVGGMRDYLVCLDGATGNRLWEADLVDRLKAPLPDFGMVCSPLLDEDSVYVQAAGSFVKLDKKTGELKWRTLDDGGGMFGSAFSSPLRTTILGRDQILVQTRTELASVDPETGEVFWRQAVPAFRGMNILTPCHSGNRIFTSSHGGGSFVFELSADEQGRVSVGEAWKNSVQAYMSSPILVEDHVYLHLRNQRITCFDLASGERPWTSSDRFGKYMSMVVQGDRILALDEQGELVLFRAHPESFDVLGRVSVTDSPAWAHIAVCGDELWIRDLGAITAWKWSDEV